MKIKSLYRMAEIILFFNCLPIVIAYLPNWIGLSNWIPIFQFNYGVIFFCLFGWWFKNFMDRVTDV